MILISIPQLGTPPAFFRFAIFNSHVFAIAYVKYVDIHGYYLSKWEQTIKSPFRVFSTV